MAEPILKYDELSDTLYISFAPGEKATGIELNDSLLLRINKAEQRAVGVTIFNYSYLAQKTAAGVRSLPLTGLASLADDLRTLFHTLNNQLGVVITYAELLEAKAPDEGLRARATQVLNAALEALSTSRQIRQAVSR